MGDEKAPDLKTLDEECGEILAHISEVRRNFNDQLDALFERVRRHQMNILHMRIVAQRSDRNDAD